MAAATKTSKMMWIFFMVFSSANQVLKCAAKLRQKTVMAAGFCINGREDALFIEIKKNLKIELLIRVNAVNCHL